LVAESLRLLVLTALFAGASAAVGYMLIMLPNVEAFTALLFVAGWTLGAARGITAALIASILYFGLNPQGGLFPPLLAAQMLGAASAPLAGVVFRKVTAVRSIHWHGIAVLLGLSAFVVTLIFDLLTNLAFPLATSMNMKGITVYLIGGIPFSLVHILSNIGIFIFIVPPLLDLVGRFHLTDAK